MPQIIKNGKIVVYYYYRYSKIKSIELNVLCWKCSTHAPCALYLYLYDLSQHCEVRGCVKFKGSRSLFIKWKGSLTGSVRDTHLLNYMFLYHPSASQRFRSHDDRYVSFHLSAMFGPCFTCLNVELCLLHSPLPT